MVWEIITAFLIGVILITFCALLFKLKIKGITGFIINAVLGGVILVALNLFHIAYFPVNPLNALIVGVLGVFGLGLIYLILIL